MKKFKMDKTKKILIGMDKKHCLEIVNLRKHAWGLRFVECETGFGYQILFCSQKGAQAAFQGMSLAEISDWFSGHSEFEKEKIYENNYNPTNELADKF